MSAPTQHHKVLIVGGGSAGITVAARLRRAKVADVAIIEPAAKHYYQPLWTLIGGGCAPQKTAVRSESSVMPKGVRWIQDSAFEVDPERNVVRTANSEVTYDNLVMCPGIQLDWGKIPGMADAVGTAAASSNYRFDLTPKTWDLIRGTTSGTAMFTMPAGPIKCAGAPQKIAYLAADYWRQQGVLDAIRVVLVLPTPWMFGVPVFAKELARVAKSYNIEVHLNSELVEVDPDGRSAVIVDHSDDTKEAITYTMLHVVPPQSAPDWVKQSPLADPANPAGYVEIDKNTMQHIRYPNVFALGDAGSSPNSKTAAAARKQAPVVVKNLLASMNGQNLTSSYGGYASCPLTTARNKMLLAEFDYTMEPRPTFPLIDTTKERRDMWYLKRYGLPAMYWNAMLKGLV